MKQPEFTIWPFGLMAVAVPLFAAGGAAVGAAHAPANADEFQSGIYFCLLGAGNAYLLAIAGGDFGRSILAVPLGAALGAAVGVIGLYTEGCLVLGLAAGAVLIHRAYTGFMMDPQGSAVWVLVVGALIGLLTLTALVFPSVLHPMELVFQELHGSAISFTLGFASLYGCIAALMPVRYTDAGWYEALSAGLAAAVPGGVVATILWPALNELLLLSVGPKAAAIIAVGTATLVWNVLSVRQLFMALRRTADEAEQQDIDAGRPEPK